MHLKIHIHVHKEYAGEYHEMTKLLFQVSVVHFNDSEPALNIFTELRKKERQ